ncbi:hypothetical protein RRG08_018466 [Elysia crispata]|uniref:Uncharacterized protein n=1 Tax=Elysia crispata TaxID=231223 RepID=A0AAE0YTH5_9GAST|nr:hypothetical protein RRG08_018466 [Elysia crispata]
MPVLFKRNSHSSLGGGGGGEGTASSSQDKQGTSASVNLHASLGMQFGAQKPTEPDERERILAGKTQTHAVTMNERKRREEFQRKTEAATVIQRTWRRHNRIKSSKRTRDLLLDCSKMSVHKKRLRATQEEWERQIAALTIQLAWRKFFRRKLLRALHPNRRQLLMWDPEIVALKQQALVHYIYNEHIEAPFWHPTLRPAIRPLWTRFIPSAAAVSYNFAVDQYYPWVARAGAIPEFPQENNPVMSATTPPPASPQPGSVKSGCSDSSAHKRGSSRAGSRPRSERGAESTGKQQKSSSANKTKSSRFSYNMRKK